MFIFAVLSELDVTFLETVLLTFETENEDLTLDLIQPYWEVLEDLVKKETILSVGMADLDKALLEQLYNWADVGLIIHSFTDIKNLLCLACARSTPKHASSPQARL